jgi:hypothetical protein
MSVAGRGREGKVINVFAREQRRAREGGCRQHGGFFIRSPSNKFFLCLFLLVPFVLTTNYANTGICTHGIAYVPQYFMNLDAYQQ